MIKNYLLTAFRNIKKYKGYSIINIAGLAIGMAVCMLIWQYVSGERSYDNFHEKGKNLYRLELSVYKDGKLHTQREKSVYPLGLAMKEEFPEVIEYARLHSYCGAVVGYKNFSAKIGYIFCADNSFLTMFSLPLVKGDPRTALAEPSSALVSESTAKKFFGDQDPIGKNIEFDRIGHWTYTIKGVFEDAPANSHLQFDFLLSIHRIFKSPYFKNPWDKYNFFTYVLLAPGADAKALQAKLPKFLEKYIGERCKQNNTQEVYSLQPISDIYLHSYDQVVNIKHGNIKAIYYFSLIAIFILIIAWINYINLSTARALDRAKEVGLRKVVGARRTQLIKQFILEALSFNSLAAIIALVLVKISIPGFNQLLGLPLSVSILNETGFWLMLILLLVIGSLLSGMYPAFILSSFQADTVLKGNLKSQSRGIVVRKGLVVFQLVASVVLITGTFTIYRQVEFMRKQDLGINTHQILVVNAPLVVTRLKNFDARLRTFFGKIFEYPTVVSATMGSVPGTGFISTAEIWREGNHKFFVKRCWVDTGFLKTFQIKLLAGRDFSRKIASDRTDAVILNETAGNLLGFKSPEEAINQFITVDNVNQKKKIIGIVKNYNHISLKNEIDPVIFQYSHHYAPSYYSIKLKSKNLSETVAFIKEKWDKYLPGNPFDYSFLDDLFNQQYKTDLQFGKVFGAFALFAIFVACIGIFGLSAHTALQRTQDIGIRKVFGANVTSILGLLSKDLIKLLVISMLIAFPIAYFVFSKWLENYAYRIGIGWWFFVVPVVIITPIILFTSAYHVVKAAMENPVNSLKYG